MAHRRAEGLFVGHARELAVASATASLLNVNWDPVNKKALNERLPLLGTALYCSDCYFYINAAVNVNMKVCGIVKGGFFANKYYDTTTGANFVTDRASTDCVSLSVADPSVFNLGMNVEAFLSGKLGYSWNIKSDGATGNDGFPDSCSGGSSLFCVLQKIFPISPVASIPLPPIIVGPVTIDLSATINGAGYVAANMPDLRLSFGASAEVTTKLGGGMSFPNIPLSSFPSVTTYAYKDFTSQYNKLPFQLSGFKDATAHVDATISPAIALTVWKTISFEATPRFRFGYDLAGKEARRAARGLACASGSAQSTSVMSGALGVQLLPVRLFTAFENFFNVDSSFLGSANVQITPAVPLIDPATNSFDTAPALSSIALSTCATVGTPIVAGGSIASSGATTYTTADQRIGIGVGIGVGLAGVGILFTLLYVCGACSPPKTPPSAGPTKPSVVVREPAGAAAVATPYDGQWAGGATTPA